MKNLENEVSKRIWLPNRDSSCTHILQHWVKWIYPTEDMKEGKNNDEQKI